MNKFFYTLDKNKISKIKKKLLDFPHGNHTVLDKDCIFLSNLILYFKPKNILEIGTWIGKSTYSMCIASSENHKNFFIDSIDVHRKIYRSKFVNFSRNIKFHNGHSSRILPKLNKKYDFIFVDANLDLLSAKCLTKLIHKNTIIVFHDYYPLGDKGLQNLINLSKFLKYNYIVDETRMFPKIKDYVNLYNGSYSKYFNFNDSKFNGTCCNFSRKLHKNIPH